MSSLRRLLHTIWNKISDTHILKVEISSLMISLFYKIPTVLIFRIMEFAVEYSDVDCKTNDVESLLYDLTYVPHVSYKRAFEILLKYSSSRVEFIWREETRKLGPIKWQNVISYDRFVALCNVRFHECPSIGTYIWITFVIPLFHDMEIPFLFHRIYE